MPVSRPLRRLLHIRVIEEEQSRLALESALGELGRLKRALAATAERDRLGRRLVVTSARSGELPDRLAGLEESCAAVRCRAALAPRIADAELDAAAMRQEFLAHRIERRQAETLIQEAEVQEAVEAGRHGQQALDDWFGNRLHREESAAEPGRPAPSRLATPEPSRWGVDSGEEGNLSKNPR
ncbi:MAG: hypothetical protein ABR898_07695 [Terracidiphilus sp.]|jgi:hypothetical protein